MEKATEEKENMDAKEENERKEHCTSTDEDQENKRAMTNEEKGRNHKEDVRKFVEMVQKEEIEPR